MAPSDAPFDPFVPFVPFDALFDPFDPFDLSKVLLCWLHG